MALGNVAIRQREQEIEVQSCRAEEHHSIWFVLFFDFPVRLVRGRPFSPQTRWTVKYSLQVRYTTIELRGADAKQRYEVQRQAQVRPYSHAPRKCRLSLKYQSPSYQARLCPPSKDEYSSCSARRTILREPTQVTSHFDFSELLMTLYQTSDITPMSSLHSLSSV
jgi:hypothetical protein